MLPVLLILACVDTAGRATPTPLIVRAIATHAVDGDSADAAAAVWTDRLRREPDAPDAAFGLGTIAELRFDTAAATHWYARLATRSTGCARAYAPYALLGLARARHRLGDAAGADSLFRAALARARAAGERGAEVRAMTAVAVMTSRTAGPAAALPSLDAAIPLVPPADTDAAVELQCTRAHLMSRAGRLDAESIAIAAADLAGRARELRPEAMCLGIAGDARQYRKDYAGSIQVYDRLAILASHFQDRSLLATARQHQGYAALELTDLGRARRYLDEAIREGTRVGNVSAVSWAIENESEVAMLANDRTAALALAQQADSIFAVTNDRWGRSTTNGLFGWLALDRGDTAEARARAEATRDWARAGSERDALIDAWVALAELAAQRGEVAGSAQLLDSAYRTAGADRGAVVLENGWGVSDIAMRSGDLPGAERIARYVLRTADPHRYTSLAELRELLALIRLRQGDTASAIAELTQATDVLDSLRAAADDRTLRTLAFEARAGGHSPHWGAVTVIAATAAHGEVAVAFQLAERRRARELLDALTRARALRATGDTEPVASPQTVARVPSLSDVQHALPDAQTALLEYVAAPQGEPTTLFVVTRSRAAAVILPPIDSLAPMIERMLAIVQSGRDDQFAGAALGERVLGQAMALLGPGIQHLWIVPDGALYRTPFAALGVGGARLVTRASVAVEPSAGIVLMLRTRPPRRGPATLLAFGDPRFSGRTARLAGSGDEARRVADYASGAVVRLGGDASGAYLKAAALDRYAVIHFATHAVVDEATVDHTVLELAPAGADDGRLGPGDLAALRLDADLVVLSACQTAGGHIVRGEGVRGLTAPLLEAGARAVVATQWRIDDRRAVSFVDAFYGALADGADLGDAIAQAQRQALATGAPTRDWAAYTVFGDPTQTIALARPRSTGRWILWSALAGVALVAVASRALAPRRSRHPPIRELVMTRVVDAPRRLVFDAWTNPEHLPHWLLGPDGWTMPVCEVSADRSSASIAFNATVKR